jgi:hypothetical protein
MAVKALKDKQVKEFFGDFNWHEDPRNKGRIIIEGNWEDVYIVHEDEVPIVGFISCHKEIILDVMKVFYKIKERGLEQYIDVDDWANGGCFVPRHKNWNMRRGLSRHSWGIAVDVNPTENPYGSDGNQHPAVIEAFEKYGFIWGGRWNFKDPMHFEISTNWSPLKPIIHPR